MSAKLGNRRAHGRMHAGCSHESRAGTRWNGVRSCSMRRVCLKVTGGDMVAGHDRVEVEEPGK